MDVDSPDQQLAWEARQRPRAAAAAIAGGVLTFGAYVGGGALIRDIPRARFGDALVRAERPGPLASLPSLQRPAFAFVDAHAGVLIALGVVSLLAAIGLAWGLGFLAVATRARRPALRRWAISLPIVGGVLVGVSSMLQQIGHVQVSRAFLNGPDTVARATGDGLDATLLQAASFIGLLATLLVAVAFVLISLNAMRAGLLTRFMGVLGVIVGLLMLFPFFGPFVQSFWLVALGVLFLGFAPRGMPPAWQTGREEPWPSAAHAAPQRRARVEPSPVQQPARTRPARRKRKRRD